MIRYALLALAAGVVFAGCSGDKPDASESQTPQLKDTSSLPDPFETLFPWDESNSDIVTTDSGLQYIVVHSGAENGPKPGLNDSATVHYDGRLAENGSQFDSSIARGEPVTFGVTQVIPGWTEALQLMVPGDEFMVYLPSDLAYGARRTPGGPIGPNADLVFRVNLIETIPDDTPGAEYFDESLPWDSASSKVTTTDTGLQYIVLSSGDTSGSQPGPTDKAKHHFEIRKAANGQRLDSSFGNERPETISIDNLIPGWAEALQLMRPGDDWMVYLPSDLAFGESGTPGGPIGANEDILMRINLIEIVVPQVSDSAAWEKYTPWNSEAEGVQKTDSGLEYIVLEEGDASKPSPTPTNRVDVYYEGRLAEGGAVFDSSYARGEPATFGVTQVISGWTEALQLMHPGDRWMVYLPADIAYGDSPRPGGLIKPGDDLIFEMQLMDIQ